MPIALHTSVIFKDGTPDFHLGFVCQDSEGIIVQRTDIHGESVGMDTTPVSLSSNCVIALSDLPNGSDEGSIVLFCGSIANFEAFIVLSQMADDQLSVAPMQFDRSGQLERVRGVMRTIHRADISAASDVDVTIRQAIANRAL